MHNVAFLDRMVRELLDSCSLEPESAELRPSTTELRALLASVIDRVVTTRDRGRIRLDAPQPVTLAIDELQIQRVIANLLQNALKYAPESPTIVARLETGAGLARVSIIDRGPGIPPEDVLHIFDMYRRAATAPGTGHGVGLFVSKRIVEAHGGTIGVCHSPGAGAQFFFELPRS